MPWKECSVVEERLRFVRLLDGEAMTELCRDFGIRGRSVTRSGIVRNFV